MKHFAFDLPLHIGCIWGGPLDNYNILHMHMKHMKCNIIIIYSIYKHMKCNIIIIH